MAARALLVAQPHEVSFPLAGRRVGFGPSPGMVADVDAWVAALAAEPRPWIVTRCTSRESTTRAAIDGAVRDNVAALRPGDLLLISISAHGFRVTSTTETDGQDECIVCSDTYYLDDDFRSRLIAAPLRSLTVVIVDSCSSRGYGTALNPLEVVPRRVVWDQWVNAPRSGTQLFLWASNGAALSRRDDDYPSDSTTGSGLLTVGLIESLRAARSSGDALTYLDWFDAAASVPGVDQQVWGGFSGSRRQLNRVLAGAALGPPPDLVDS